MLTKKGKLIFTVVSFVSVLSCIVLLYLGYHFFRDRTVVYWVYDAYIVAVTGIVLFMVHRYLKIYIT